jgi:hypothetical protein
MSKTMSSLAIERALIQLADPEVNSEIYFASTITVAKDIIQSLPGVKQLRKDGPKVAEAVLPLVQLKQTQENECFLAIALHILEAYPSENVKFGLARPIVGRHFSGLNGVLAAETFLKAVGIRVPPKDVVATALREAIKIVGPKRKPPRKSSASPSRDKGPAMPKRK